MSAMLVPDSDGGGDAVGVALGCDACGTDPAAVDVLRGVDSSGLLNLVSCEGCGRVLGRYWGLL